VEGCHFCNSSQGDERKGRVPTRSGSPPRGGAPMASGGGREGRDRVGRRRDSSLRSLRPGETIRDAEGAKGGERKWRVPRYRDAQTAWRAARGQARSKSPGPASTRRAERCSTRSSQRQGEHGGRQDAGVMTGGRCRLESQRYRWRGQASCQKAARQHTAGGKPVPLGEAERCTLGAGLIGC
jgi:hypothetical protein